MKFHAKVLSLLGLVGFAVVETGGSHATYTCDDVACGAGYVCQMVKPPHCPHCPSQPQCLPPTSCDQVDCPTGYECQVNDPPSGCPHCLPQAFCKPSENQYEYCGAGETYNYQSGKCAPSTCESPNVSAY